MGARGIENGTCDLRISGTPADVTAHPLAHVLIAVCVAFRDASHRRKDLSRRTVAALQCIVPNEGPLYCVEIGRIADALNGDDLVSLALRGQNQTAVHTLAINEHGAGSACTLVAPLLGACEVHLLAQIVE